MGSVSFGLQIGELPPHLRELRRIYISPHLEAFTGLPARAFLGRTNRGLGMPDALVGLWDRTSRQVFRTVKYTRQGRILLGGRRTGPMLRLQVWDTGIGIPADQIEAIFEAFRQLDTPARNRRKGLGLGLPLGGRRSARDLRLMAGCREI